ncbi:MAG: PASTA domain-containing protein [Nocardiopsaceae bacterium]|jgi:serine/threonine-protein kinase|nr:PASTA domain-containing protein [Nocardiopsaceae bacterium]
MDTTVARSPIGQLLDGRYRVDSHIASGGMADVYLGTDTRLERTVALKVMRAELASDQDFVRRFIGEARSVARLSHPNVVAVFDQGSDGRILYLAMEYVPGQTLRSLLSQHGRLSPRATLDIMDGVLSGLAAAHEAGLAHRDVKPENVLLGERGAVKVADFGLARLNSAARHTKSGTIIGTAAYLAPEQVAQGAADARTDVYAAGVMLFELLTGGQPHTGETPLAVAYKHVNDVVPAPSSVVPGVPPALDALVAMATSRDPDLRPGDAGQFLRAITGVRYSLPPDPPPELPGGNQAGHDSPPPGVVVPPGEWPGEQAGSPAEDLIPGMGPPLPARQSLGTPADAGTSLATHRLRQDPYQQPNQTLVVQAGDHPYSDHPYGAPPYGAPPYGGPPYGGPPFGTADGTYRPSSREPGLQRWLFSRRLAYLAAAMVTVVLAGALVWWLAAGRYTTVPRVGGLTLAAARADLRSAGLTDRVGRAQLDNQISKGSVIRTVPANGARVGNGSQVTLIVSAGPHMLGVPQVTGQPLANAQAALKQAGLTAGPVSKEPSATIPAGIVISTNPPAGTSWPQPKPVQVTVSAGPPVPNLVGQQKAVAEQWAQQNGVSLNEVQVNNSTQPAGTITHQSPQPGAAFTKGEVITVRWSAGPQPVSIPNVDGMSVTKATRQLERLGFQVSVIQAGPLHVVFHHSPDGQAPRGSTITLWAGLPSSG